MILTFLQTPDLLFDYFKNPQYVDSHVNIELVSQQSERLFVGLGGRAIKTITFYRNVIDGLIVFS